eukprot:562155-Rhodomonas_salina.1
MQPPKRCCSLRMRARSSCVAMSFCGYSLKRAKCSEGTCCAAAGSLSRSRFLNKCEDAGSSLCGSPSSLSSSEISKFATHARR